MCLIITIIVDFSYSNLKFVDVVFQILTISHQSVYFYFIELFLNQLLFALN